MFRKKGVNKRFGFSSLLWCLATWRREPSASPRNSNVSICPPRGPGTCRRAALRRYISLLRLPGKSPRLFCVNPPQILQCYCVLRPPPFAPREYRPHYSCLHVKKRSTKAAAFPLQAETFDFLHLCCRDIVVSLKTICSSIKILQ